MRNKILIFGNGQIGNFYLNHYKETGTADAFLTEADITVPAEIQKAIDEFFPNVVINTAAQTNLEWCANNRLEAFNANVLGADNLAQACDQNNIYFIHFSSGCIFESKDENDLKKEDAPVKPLSFYSWTKVWAENLIQYNKSKDFKYLILRPRQPISAQVNYKNMLMKMITFSKFIDVPNGGVSIEDLMTWTDELIEKKATGVLNVSNEGWTTPYQISLLLKKHILPDLEPIKITKEELNVMTPEKRVDTILDVSRLKSLVKEVKPYKQRMEETIIELAENIKKADKSFLEQELNKTVEQTKQRSVTNEVWKNLLK